MPLWKIIIEGKTEYDVQGVNLREDVVSVAYKKKIKCKARNRKGTKKVAGYLDMTSSVISDYESGRRKSPGTRPRKTNSNTSSAIKIIWNRY